MTCSKGMMKWTHRAMILAFVLLIVGLALIIVASDKKYSKQEKDSLTYGGIALVIVYAVIMLVSLFNALSKGCYATALGAFFLI